MERQKMNEWVDIKTHCPNKEGWYLCCGDLIEWNMKDSDPPDSYFLCYFSNGWGREILPGAYDEVKIMYWMELPKLPEKK